MELTKQDKRLFKILDKEIKKELTFGCIIKVNAIYDMQTEEVTTIIGKDSIKDGNLEDFPSRDYFAPITKVYGVYPNHAEVLRYIGRKNDNSFDYYKINFNDTRLELGGCLTNSFESLELKLDLTKDIKDYAEEEKEKLNNFLEEIK